MICNKKDLQNYLEIDRKANGFNKFFHRFNILNKYLVRLRKTEYYYNCHPKGFRFLLSKYLLNRLSIKTGITIGLNCFGKGLYIPHYGYIVVNSSSRFGDYCVLQCGVNISRDSSGGDSIFFGTGAKIMVGVYIPSFTIIGANAVVTKSFKEENLVIAGVPAKIISNSGMKSNREYI